MIETVLCWLAVLAPVLILGTVLPAEGPPPGTRRIPLGKITVNPGQARKNFPPDDLRRLAGSLRERGQLNPLIVRYDAGRDLYILSSGERRFRAMQLLGWAEAECKVLDREPDESDMLKESVIENELRESLNPIELGKALFRLQSIEGGTMESLAQSLNVHPVKASRAVSLLTLPPRAQEMVAEGRIGIRAACTIVRFPSEAEQLELAEAAAAGKLTCLQIEERLAERLPRRPDKPRQARVSVTEGEYSLTVVGPDRAGMLEALVGLLKGLRVELRNGGRP